MTKEDWKKVEEWWGISRRSMKLLIDGHKINLYNTIDSKKMIVYVSLYVDDFIKGEYSKIDNEIGNKFYQRTKLPLYSSRELKERIKDFGKKSKYAKQAYYEMNNLYWRSFNAFKKHITTHNESIELITKDE